ncbi:MAG: class I SAM-dependent methyltransferase [Methylococcaceae bacterium]
MWTEGYVTEIDYTHGYYRELSPALLRFACLVRGLSLPEWKDMKYLELGFGQGLSINIHAAASPGTYWGTDFNPSQVANAQNLLNASGVEARLFDHSFAELAARTDLPQFDVIALHGIWSWISPENQQNIIDIVRRHLAVGGVLYMSYNTLPGWASAMPFRHLMQLHADVVGADAQGMVGKIDAALQFSQQVVDSGALFFRANPSVGERIKKVAEQNRNYLAHEYFNADWQPMYFSEVATRLEEAKLTFATTAHLLDHIDSINLTAEVTQQINTIRHGILRETVRDYHVNQQFRRDIFTKGQRTLSTAEQMNRLREVRVVLVTDLADVPLTVKGNLGEAQLQEGIYRPILEWLAAHGPKSLAELEHGLAGQVNFPAIIQATLILMGNGHLSLAQEVAVVEQARAACARLNRALCEQARYSPDVAYLASPVTGGGVALSRFSQLFLLAIRQGMTTPEQWAQAVWSVLAEQNQRIVKEGKPIESPEDNLAELLTQAREFHDKRLPVLKTLGIDA